MGIWGRPFGLLGFWVRVLGRQPKLLANANAVAFANATKSTPENFLCRAVT